MYDMKRDLLMMVTRNDHMHQFGPLHDLMRLEKEVTSLDPAARPTQTKS